LQIFSPEVTLIRDQVLINVGTDRILPFINEIQLLFDGHILNGILQI